MSNFIYNIIIQILSALSPVIELFLPKYKEREKEYETLLEGFSNYNKQVIWFHSASMGEFEQAKPLIEMFRADYPGLFILCTFYSPSGYNNQKNYKFADYIMYLPFDTKRRIKSFLDKIQPEIAVFVRYEIWGNILHELNNRNIKTYMICGTKPGSFFLSNLFIFRFILKDIYDCFNTIFTVGETHSEFFRKLGIKSKIITLTDTRFDRIYNTVLIASENKLLTKEIFNEDEFILVAGSTWEADENLIINSLVSINGLNKKLKLIIVPHEPSDSVIRKLSTKIPGSLLLSELLDMLSKESIQNVRHVLSEKHIIVDSIGNLLKLYSVADIAYIGGGFGAGVHSVTEPAGYDLPLACGPGMTNSPDAGYLRDIGALRIINNDDEMTEWISQLINDNNLYRTMCSLSGEYIRSSIGSTVKIFNELKYDISSA